VPLKEVIILILLLMEKVLVPIDSLKDEDLPPLNGFSWIRVSNIETKPIN